MSQLDTGRVSKLCTFLNLGPNILGRAKVYSLVHLEQTPTPDAIVVTRVVMHPLLLWLLIQGGCAGVKRLQQHFLCIFFLGIFIDYAEIYLQ